MTSTAGLRLVTRRLIPASPERLFEAWTSPALLCQWWGPPGGRCTNAIVEPVVGGTYRLDNTLADGSAVVISGSSPSSTRRVGSPIPGRSGPDRTAPNS